MSDLPPVLTPQQAADYLQVGEDVVLFALRGGELGGFKVGGRWRIHRATFQRWIGQDVATVPAPPPEQDRRTDLSTIDVAKMLGWTPSTAWRHMSSGDIASVQRGKQWITTLADVEAFLARSNRSASTEAPHKRP